jgi:hypothetical protein
VIDMEIINVVRPTGASPAGERACHHEPRCPSADAPDRLAARIIAYHPEQGWELLCNGIISFDDSAMILPAA